VLIGALVVELNAVTQRATKVARNSTKVLPNETIKSDFGGFFIMVCMGFFLYPILKINFFGAQK
jgi:hypothetical protein